MTEELLDRGDPTTLNLPPAGDSSLATEGVMAAWPENEAPTAPPPGFQPPTKYTCRTLDKTGDREPIFVLRAQDVLAADTIRFWRARLEDVGGSPEKVAHTLKVAQAFEAWGRENVRKIPD